MNNIQQKIRGIYRYYQSKNTNHRRISRDDNLNFLSIVNKNISIDYIKGGYHKLLHKHIENLSNRQVSLLKFIANFTKAVILGGAGTGKSYLAYKLIETCSCDSVLFITLSKALKDHANQILNIKSESKK